MVALGTPREHGRKPVYSRQPVFPRVGTVLARRQPDYSHILPHFPQCRQPHLGTLLAILAYPAKCWGRTIARLPFSRLVPFSLFCPNERSVNSRVSECSFTAERSVRQTAFYPRKPVNILLFGKFQKIQHFSARPG